MKYEEPHKLEAIEATPEIDKMQDIVAKIKQIIDWQANMADFDAPTDSGHDFLRTATPEASDSHDRETQWLTAIRVFERNILSLEKTSVGRIVEQLAEPIKSITEICQKGFDKITSVDRLELTILTETLISQLELLSLVTDVSPEKKDALATFASDVFEKSGDVFAKHEDDDVPSYIDTYVAVVNTSAVFGREQGHDIHDFDTATTVILRKIQELQEYVAKYYESKDVYLGEEIAKIAAHIKADLASLSEQVGALLNVAKEKNESAQKLTLEDWKVVRLAIEKVWGDIAALGAVADSLR